MKIGIVLSTKDPEAAWNALRFGVTGRRSGHTVRMFLMNAGVELEDIRDPKFDVPDQLRKYREGGGEILACGTCLDTRDKEGTETCPTSTMAELLAIVEQSDRVLTFG